MRNKLDRRSYNAVSCNSYKTRIPSHEKVFFPGFVGLGTGLKFFESTVDLFIICNFLVQVVEVYR